MIVNRRIQARENYEAPIIYAKYNDGDFHEATMYNSSQDGMYFESACDLRQGLYVYIKLAEPGHDICLPGAYVGQVRWCIKKNNASIYGIGVRFMARGHIINGKNAERSDCSCDLCGEITPEEILMTDDALSLCHDCFKRLGGLIEGNIKNSILRFMAGNVF